MGASSPPKSPYDSWLLFSVISLLGVGLVMVVSASLSFAESVGKNAWYFGVRHLGYLMAGFFFCILTTHIPLTVWLRLRQALLGITLCALALLLVPGVGREVNGSVRWLFLGPISIQLSEVAKLCMIIYLAGYLVQKDKEVKTQLSGFLKPIAVLGLVALLLLAEPDFGATVVILATSMGLLFLGGVPLRRFLVLLLITLIILGALSILSPYRFQRLTSFLDPWSVQFNSGYQLTQSLIAFGRGGWFGVGLGNSVQKLLYLPLPHTDFIYAVLAEELGLAGAVSVLSLFSLFVWRTLVLGRRAVAWGLPFAGFVAYGVGLWFGFQAIINIGVNMGVLPTKGLTLPLVSYGGSSLLVSFIAIGLLLRIEYEIAGRAKK